MQHENRTIGGDGAITRRLKVTGENVRLTDAVVGEETICGLGVGPVEDLGFKAVYLTGAGLTNTNLGLPDLGFMDLSQVAEHVLAIRGVVELPLIVDIDTGFGNALNVAHTIRTLEQAGASAVQLEDQRAPKRTSDHQGAP